MIIICLYFRQFFNSIDLSVVVAIYTVKAKTG